MAGHKAKANYKTFPCVIARDELKSTPSAFYLQHTKNEPMNKVYLSPLTHYSSALSNVYYHWLKGSWEEFLCVLYAVESCSGRYSKRSGLLGFIMVTRQ